MRRHYGPPRPRPRPRPRPKGNPAPQVPGDTYLLGFRIEEGLVNLIDEDGENIPLFPAGRINPGDVRGSLRSAVATVMQDLGPEDNGVL